LQALDVLGRLKSVAGLERGGMSANNAIALGITGADTSLCLLARFPARGGGAYEYENVGGSEEGQVAYHARI
jgi:hypothetical protein